MEGRRVQEDLNRRSDGFSKSHPSDQYNQIRNVNKSYETPWGDDNNYKGPRPVHSLRETGGFKTPLHGEPDIWTPLDHGFGHTEGRKPGPVKVLNPNHWSYRP